MDARNDRTARVSLLLAGLLVVAMPVAAEDEKKPPAVDQAAVNAAIKKGADWLLERSKEGIPVYEGNDEWKTLDEMVLYALLHSGVDRNHPEVVRLLNVLMGRIPNHTYTAALRNMALQKYNPTLLRDHIKQTSQYLIDIQGQRGFWGYGKQIDLPTLPKPDIKPDPQKVYSGPKGGVAEAPTPAGGGKSNTTVLNRFVLKRNGFGDENDNSNTQYAMLGLFAGMAAGFYPPPDLLDLTEKWLTDQQNDDGGWNYRERGDQSTGAMTAGGVSSVCIILRARNNLMPKKDIRVQKALKWLGERLTFDGNPNGGWHYYWIYSVERAGSTSGTEWFGDRPWYKEGADWLLSKQNADGSWGGDNGGKKIADTSWALLFLNRATRGITFTISSPNRK